MDMLLISLIWWSFHNVYAYQTITLNILNIYNFNVSIITQQMLGEEKKLTLKIRVPNLFEKERGYQVGEEL